MDPVTAGVLFGGIAVGAVIGGGGVLLGSICTTLTVLSMMVF